MRVRSEEAGIVPTFSGDIAVFNIEMIDLIAERIGVSRDDLLNDYAGVQAHVGANKLVGVDTVHSVLNDGIVVPSVLINSYPDDLKRFLTPEEKTFKEFREEAMQRWDEDIEAANNYNFAKLEQDYTNYVLGRKAMDGDMRPNSDLDELMGG